MKEKIINQIKFIIFGILVILQIIIVFTLWFSLEGEMLILSIIAIILIPILFWLGSKKNKLNESMKEKMKKSTKEEIEKKTVGKFSSHTCQAI